MLFFERKTEPLAPPSVFLTRIAWSFLASLLVVAASLGIGTVGYHVYGQLPWIDALLNASMILTGMGPVDPLKTSAGKLFGVFYCLFSGIVFLTLMAVILAPLYHRFLHSFHLDEEQESVERQQGRQHPKRH